MTVKVNDICLVLEEFAPLALQESYDNAGLIIGNREMLLSGVLLCIDVTEEVIAEAVSKNCNMVVSHHPLIFKGLKVLPERDAIERTVVAAIKNNIAVYAAHTNMDNVAGGVNTRIAEKIGLKNIQLLLPAKDSLLKLITFVPDSHAGDLRKAIFEAGAGHIGQYDCCSFNVQGEGTFRANAYCNPFVGSIGNLHTEKETRIEVIIPSHLKNKVLKALLTKHPYEEPAVDIIPLQNTTQQIGIGIVGELDTPENESSFLRRLKTIFGLKSLRHTDFLGHPISKVALCGGSGSGLIKNAINAKADVFLSADFKYHDFFLAEKRLLIADIGHFESEQYTKEIFFEQITKKFPTFAIRFSEINTNPINYL